ncbi:MAG: DUF5606 domain-containing protein [Bacteroides sp.]|nr:DUF5606 domain-containing protein [Ruminococcus flavefaciens]MCM1554200.1 DUF5606 domain-containing protein [Bacteroides sp.]
MDLEKILTIPTKPSLYRLVSQSKVSAIVESLQDKKRMPVFGLEKVSSLAEIAIYTQDGKMSLPNVFRAMHKALDGKKAQEPAQIKNLKEYFAQFVPDFDTEHVYDSNIKKVLAWYNLLIDNNLVDQELSEREKAQIEGLAQHEAEEAAEAKEAEEKPAKTAAKPAAKAKKAEPKAAAKPAAEKAAKSTAKPAAKAAAKPKAAAAAGSTKTKATVKKTSASAK